MVDQHFIVKTENDTAKYGKYIIEPLDQGYGQTLGNSIRRVLLTSLPGAAVTAVKIEGVKHQFSTLAGLKEDIVELLLNIKRVRLVIEGDGPVTLKLSKKGPAEVTAADLELPAGVTVVNPEQVIGTLADKKASLEMELTGNKGYGFISAEENRGDEIGVIPLDAVYTPVQRVNYRVEATRVGRMTNLDRLVMEIWTDGTISPLDAIKQSSKILVGYFTQIYEPTLAGAVEATAAKPAVSEEVLKMRIEELDIPTRIVNALANGGIETVGQLVSAPHAELLKVKNLGAKSLSIVEDKLREKGVVLNG